MKPVMCTEPNDCLRACIASILEVDAETVPHPFAGHPHEWDACYDRLLSRLSAIHGVWLFVVRIRARDISTHLESLYGYAILCGASRKTGAPHAVVVSHLGVVHDPADPDNHEMIAPEPANDYVVMVLAKGVL
jgi:hypothetical protein